MINTLIKWVKFRREIEKRRIQEAHISSGGCVFCWDMEKHKQGVLVCGVSGYMAYLYLLACQTKRCPVGLSGNAKRVLSEIKVKD